MLSRSWVSSPQAASRSASTLQRRWVTSCSSVIMRRIGPALTGCHCSTRRQSRSPGPRRRFTPSGTTAWPTPVSGCSTASERQAPTSCCRPPPTTATLIWSLPNWAPTTTQNACGWTAQSIRSRSPVSTRDARPRGVRCSISTPAGSARTSSRSTTASMKVPPSTSSVQLTSSPNVLSLRSSLWTLTQRPSRWRSPRQPKNSSTRNSLTPGSNL